jgi:hypothetical protein
MIRNSCLFLSASLGLLGVATAQFTPGNLVVTRIGTGAAPLNNASTAVFLDEYTPGGTLVQSVAMPTAASGSNLPFAISGSATSEGQLTQSADGRFLMATGYAIAPGTASIAGTASASVPRVIARIGLDGSIDTSTSIDNLFSGNNIRCAASEDGSAFWAAGGNSGIVYATYGATSGLSLNTALPTNIRCVGIFGGQLYFTSGSGSNRGINSFGGGLPTTSGQVPQLLNGFPTTTSPSPYDFFFADADTAYVADDRTAATGGGIQKWTQSGGVWTLQYTLSPGTVGCRGLSGYVDNGVVTLFAVTSASLGQLVSVVDTGSAPGTFTTIATAPTNTALRGVRYVRTPSLVAEVGTGSPTTVGVPGIARQNGWPTIGNSNFAIAASNLLPNGFAFSLLGIGAPGAGTPVAGAPATVQVYVNPVTTQLLLADANGDASLPLPLPNVTAFVGLPLAVQVLAFDGALAAVVPLGSSAALALQLGN